MTRFSSILPLLAVAPAIASVGAFSRRASKVVQDDAGEDSAFWERYLQNSVAPIPAPTIPSPVAVPTTPEVPGVPTEPPCTTILDIACSQADFSTLCSLLETTGLGAVVGDATTSFTVFAPTNGAFEVIASVLPGLSEQQIVFVLLYHVASGVIAMDDLVCDGEIVMANELPTTTICTVEGEIFQVGTGNVEPTFPQVVTTDIEACNGIIHVIDNVILPDVVPDSPEIQALIREAPDVSVVGQLEKQADPQDSFSDVPSDAPSLSPSSAPTSIDDLLLSDVPSDSPSLSPSAAPTAVDA